MPERTVKVHLQAAVGQYQAAMARAAASTRTLQTQVSTAAAGGRRSLGRLGGAAAASRGSLRELGAEAGLLNPKLIGGAGLAFGIKSVADAAIGWESAFAGVKKTVSGTPEQLGAINDGLRDMSKQIPTSAEDLASVAESAGQLGIQTDNVLGFTKTIADLGETTDLVGEQGAQALARFANITGMAQSDFDRLGSVIVDLGNNSATTESQIVDMALRVAGAGEQIGMTEGEILGWSAALSSAGIRAEAGGTAISKVMIDIANEIETGGDKIGMFAETAGMSVEEFATAFEEDASAAILAFVEGLGRMEEQGGSTLGQLEDLGITEVRMRDALLRLSSNSDLVSDALDRQGDAWEDNTALTEEASQRYDTTAAKMQMAKNAVHDLAIEFGEGLAPAVGEASTALTDMLDFEVPGAGGIDIGDVVVGATLDLATGGGSEFAFDKINNERLKLPTTVNEGAERSIRSQTDALFRRAEAYKNSIPHEARSLTLTEALGQAAGPAGSAVGGLGDEMDETAGKTENATMSLEEYEEALQRSTDPVFNLTSALEDVESAQEAYTDAVDKYGPQSDEARAASLNLAQAIAGAEAAAIDGDLSFSAFSDRLDTWVDMGLITADQAKTMRARVKELREESERYEGNYRAEVGLSGYGNTLAQLERLARAADRVGDDIHVAVSGTTIGGRTRAGGGPVWPGEEFLVGEDGPEVVTFGRSGYVHDAATTARMMAGAGQFQPRGGIGSSSTTDNSKTVHLTVNGRVDHRDMFRARNLAGTV